MRASLTVRLVAGVVLAQLLLAGGLVWAGIAFTRWQLRQAFDVGLEGRLMGVAALVRYPERPGPLVFDASRLPPAADLRHPSFYRVEADGGAVVTSTFPADVALPPTAEGRLRYWRFRRGGVPYRGVMLPRLPILDAEEDLPGPPALLTLYYAAPLLQPEREVSSAGWAIAGTSLALLLLTSLLAAFTIRRELRPLRELARQAAAISPHNWEFEPNPNAAPTPELAPLVAALRLMLGRLHASYQQQRTFMADAAHHLKTPVAILKSTLQSLLRRPRELDEYVAAAQASLLDVERLEQLLQRMLRLARLEQSSEEEQRGARPSPLAGLGASCQAALERVQPLARARGVALRSVNWEGEWQLRADADDLELVWMNLLENAVQHSPAGATVEIACEADADAVTVRVRDQGPGVSAAEAPFIFERFRRGADSQPGGFGLGLAIARAIVEAYGGTIELETPTDPASTFRGATFRVNLPLAIPGAVTAQSAASAKLMTNH